LKSLSILIIDDEESFLNAIAHFLVKHGHSVVKATTIADGLGVLKKEKFDLLLLDLALPDGNGIEVLKQISSPDKAIAGLNKNMQVIILTAHGNAQFVLEAMQLGAFDCLSKPFELKVLEGKINKIFK
jgi:DNA-binding response OmpR family regulator